LSKDTAAGSWPLTSPIRQGQDPASVPSDEKFRSWSDAAWVVNGPGLKLKSSDPAVPVIEEVSTVTK
jgi:hypothetical protein